MNTLGMPYQEVEKTGVISPITEVDMKSLSTTQHYALLTIRSTSIEMKKVNFFDYQITNEQGVYICETTTHWTFGKIDNWRLCPSPFIQI